MEDMKKFITSLLILAFLSTSSTTIANDTLEDHKKDTESIWRTGSGAHDGSSTAISTSIIGWGVGLALGIAILAAVLHQSKSQSGHSHCSGK
jgi:hypothetical protein